MTIPEKAVQWAVDIANDNSHGYDQGNRWGPDYDCSSLVISAYKHAGVPLTCTYTGNMKSDFLSHGFIQPRGVNLSLGAGLVLGDVLLHEKNHTALYIGNNKIVHASINEKGGVTGGQTGDQTGGEITVRTYYNYPWDCVLRYGAEEDTQYTAPVSLPLASRGDVGGAVLSVQILLIHKWAVSCGIDGADGDFGPNTESAVKAFQTHKGLDPDGVVGPMTWQRLIGG